MAKKAIGIDIGGTGIKGALVDVKNGKLVGERVRYETPEGGHPQDIATVVAKLVRDLGPVRATLPVGVCFPAVVQHGRTMSAANVS
ncbi:MAG: ROK family protein, partial [Rhodoluna sp.]